MDNDFPKAHIKIITVELIDPLTLLGQKPTVFELSRILHEYADMIKDGRGGQRSVEVYTDSLGNKLTSVSAQFLGHEISHKVHTDWGH